MLGQIIRLQLSRVVARIRQNHGVELSYDAGVINLISARCTEPESGGRMIDAILTNALLPAISREVAAANAPPQSRQRPSAAQCQRCGVCLRVRVSAKGT